MGERHGFAGHAIAPGVVLVTNNTRVFERVPGLIPGDRMKQRPKDCRGRFSKSREAGIVSGVFTFALWHQMESRYFHILQARLHHKAFLPQQEK